MTKNKLEELQKDAARYRYLRGLSCTDTPPGMRIMLAVPRPEPNDWCLDSVSGAALDAAIDNAMRIAGVSDV